MKAIRLIAALVTLTLLAPTLLSAMQLCAMGGCPMRAMSDHRCCQRIAPRLQASCCEEQPSTLASSPKAPEPARDELLATGPASGPSSPAPATLVDAARVLAAIAQPPDRLARTCVLRI